MASTTQKLTPRPPTTAPEVRHRYAYTEKRPKTELKNEKKKCLNTQTALKQSKITQISRPKIKLTKQAATHYFH